MQLTDAEFDSIVDRFERARAEIGNMTERNWGEELRSIAIGINYRMGGIAFGKHRNDFMKDLFYFRCCARRRGTIFLDPYAEEYLSNVRRSKNRQKRLQPFPDRFFSVACNFVLKSFDVNENVRIE